MSDNNLLITICGRGGSKGIPGKNIRDLNGKSLIAYTIMHAQKFAAERPNTDIVLSTDSLEIKSIAAENGLITGYLRPASLAGDTIGKMEVLRHVLEYQETLTTKRYDLLLDMDITSPLRTQNDLRKGLEMLMADPEAYNIFSVSKPHRNPYFNVVEQKDDGYCKVVKPSDSLSRQAAPRVYDMNASFYFFRRICFEKKFRSSITEKSLFYLMEHVCFDLDEPLDFEMMEFLVNQGKLGFEI
jgi:CMP-N-acetylneuraminic acid synthetase